MQQKRIRRLIGNYGLKLLCLPTGTSSRLLLYSVQQQKFHRKNGKQNCSRILALMGHTLMKSSWQLWHESFRAIKIFNVHTLQPITVSGHLPWETNPTLSGPPLELAYRPHKLYWSHDKHFRPIGPSEGHYWPILHAKRFQGNQQRSDSTRPQIWTSSGARLRYPTYAHAYNVLT